MPHGGDSIGSECGTIDPAPGVLRAVFAAHGDDVAKFNKAFPQISHKTSGSGRGYTVGMLPFQLFVCGGTIILFYVLFNIYFVTAISRVSKNC